MRLNLPLKPARAPWSRSAVALALSGALGLAGVVWSLLRGAPNPWRLAGHPDPAPLSGALLGLLLGLALVLASRLSVAHYRWARWLERDFRDRLGPLNRRECFLLALASSLGEEIFFRGALLPTVGLGWSAVIFALVHLGPMPAYLPWTLSAFLAGLALGALQLWSGDLGGPLLAHFILNFLNLRHLSRRR